MDIKDDDIEMVLWDVIEALFFIGNVDVENEGIPERYEECLDDAEIFFAKLIKECDSDIDKLMARMKNPAIHVIQSKYAQFKTLIDPYLDEDNRAILNNSTAFEKFDEDGIYEIIAPVKYKLQELIEEFVEDYELELLEQEAAPVASTRPRPRP